MFYPLSEVLKTNDNSASTSKKRAFLIVSFRSVFFLVIWGLIGLFLLSLFVVDVVGVIVDVVVCFVFFVPPFFVKEFPRFDRLISANLG